MAAVGGTPSIFAEAAGTSPKPAATAKASKAKKRPMETSPPAVGIAASENLLSHIETLADTADMPETAQKEREASTTEKGKPKGSSTRRRYPRKTRPPPPEESTDDKPLGETPIPETLVDTLVDSQPAVTAKVPNGVAKKAAKCQMATAKAKANTKETSGEDQVTGPYSLHHRWKPFEKSQCYIMGTVGGQPKTFITNVSVAMSHDFCKLMMQILQEANENKFATKGDIVQRRDELVAKASAAATAPAGDEPGNEKSPAATATPAATAAAGEQTETPEWIREILNGPEPEAKHYEDGQEPEDSDVN